MAAFIFSEMIFDASDDNWGASTFAGVSFRELAVAWFAVFLIATGSVSDWTDFMAIPDVASPTAIAIKPIAISIDFFVPLHFESNITYTSKQLTLFKCNN